MGKPIIKVENLGKSFVIKHYKNDQNQDNLRDMVANTFSSTVGKLFNVNQSEIKSSHQETFWALRGVSFEVNAGDKMAIIGANGAGKSTLFKLLSRITRPSEGKITLNGSVASMLEIGTGFHPELTGRENIFLNGAILGMKKSDVKIHFDAIVDFSEIEHFLDTPVKRYSSGMYVKLAFAVSSFLKSDILILDEVLAVGDAAFQSKCIKKLNEISQSGRTILFVSHSIDTVLNICDKAVYLKDGRLINNGSAKEVIQQYQSGF